MRERIGGRRKDERRPGSRRLGDLAREASEKLDSVFAEGEGSRAVQELIGADGAGAQAANGPAASSAAGGALRPGGRKPVRALVSHVSFGMATVLANILRSAGLSTGVVTAPEELDLDPDGFGWDIVFLQGAAMPYPGSKLVRATLARWAGSNSPLVFLRRPGEPAIPGGGGIDVSAFLEWPFEPGDVRRKVCELLRQKACAAPLAL